MRIYAIGCCWSSCVAAAAGVARAAGAHVPRGVAVPEGGNPEREEGVVRVVEDLEILPPHIVEREHPVGEEEDRRHVHLQLDGPVVDVVASVPPQGAPPVEPLLLVPRVVRGGGAVGVEVLTWPGVGGMLGAAVDRTRRTACRRSQRGRR